MRINGSPCSSPDWRLRTGQRVEVVEAKAETERAALDVVIRHVDADLVVVEKPAGLTTVRHEDEAAEWLDDVLSRGGKKTKKSTAKVAATA